MKGTLLKSLVDRMTNPEDYIYYNILLCRTVGLLLPSQKYLPYSIILALCLFAHLITEVIDLVLISSDVEKVATNLTITTLTFVALLRLMDFVFGREKYHSLVYEVILVFVLGLMTTVWIYPQMDFQVFHYLMELRVLI